MLNETGKSQGCCSNMELSSCYYAVTIERRSAVYLKSFTRVLCWFFQGAEVGLMAVISLYKLHIPILQ